MTNVKQIQMAWRPVGMTTYNKPDPKPMLVGLTDTGAVVVYDWVRKEWMPIGEIDEND